MNKIVVRKDVLWQVGYDISAGMQLLFVNIHNNYCIADSEIRMAPQLANIYK